MLPEVRIADPMGLRRAKKLSCCEAAEMLGMSERHLCRLREADEAHGAEGRIDGWRAPMGEVRTRQLDVTAQRFYEAVLSRPMSDGVAFKRSYTWTKGVQRARGLVTKAPKCSVHRRKRVHRGKPAPCPKPLKGWNEASARPPPPAGQTKREPTSHIPPNRTSAKAVDRGDDRHRARRVNAAASADRRLKRRWRP